jgi:hypothetical protein
MTPFFIISAFVFVVMILALLSALRASYHEKVRRLQAPVMLFQTLADHQHWQRAAARHEARMQALKSMAPTTHLDPP